MHNSSRRTGEKLLPNAIRECPVVRGCREKNQGESILLDSAQGRFGGWWIWFLFHFPDRHAKFRNMVEKAFVGLENLNKVRNVGGGVGLGQFGGPERARLPQVDGDENAPFPQN